MRGMLYISRKKSVGGDGSNQHTEEQLGNSCPIANKETTAKLRGMLYISRKKEHGGDRKNEESSYQSDNLITERKTHEVVAKETGVSPATIMRDAAYSEACDKLGITDTRFDNAAW